MTTATIVSAIIVAVFIVVALACFVIEEVRKINDQHPMRTSDE
jgi:hypothetical protein